MKRIQAYVRTQRLEEIIQSLEDAGLRGISVESTRGYGRQMGQTEQFRGSTYALNLVPKTRLDIVVDDDELETAIEAITSAARTGELGDGKIFVSEVQDVIRIRTGERGSDAVH
jgi:nitrogen regulatory protein P-II 1